MQARHIVLGTAGHIDHGKSSLVRALTGIDPDRLQEEKRRGITIELGFADLDLGQGRVLSLVDVPGHERFVRHMVAGASGMDAVMLVVAADQGVQPQTREHLHICSLLDLRRGLVVVTKTDLVERELLDVVVLELEELVRDTFLESAPVLRVSAKTGEGLDALRQALVSLVESQPPRQATGLARLPIDRSFVLKGFGTVVTGTLVSGTLRGGEEVEVLPGHARGRIRGLQVHGKAVESAMAGQRTAVNLQGLDCADVPRGATLTVPSTLATTRRAWARLYLLPSAPESLKKGGPARFHQGTCERQASIRVLGALHEDELGIELHLGRETVLAPGDRFILRRPSPVDTVGGGVIFDVRPPARKEYEAEALDLARLKPAAAIQARLARAGVAGREAVDLCSELGMQRDELQGHLSWLEQASHALQVGSRWVEQRAWQAKEELALQAVRSFHQKQPLRAGLTREELRSAVGREMPRELWRELLESLARRQAVRLEGERIAEAGHRVVLDAAGLELARRIEEHYRKAALDPPDQSEVSGNSERDTAAPIIDYLIRQGKLVRIQDGRLFHAEALDRLRSKLRDYARRSSTIDVGDFKQLAGVTRKNAIPLLEQLDAERTTRRVGNLREILTVGHASD